MNDGPISSHLVHRVGCLILITTRAGGVEVDVVSRAPHLPLLAPEQTGVKQLWFVKYSVAFSILSHLSAPPWKEGILEKESELGANVDTHQNTIKDHEILSSKSL